jgi:hypothetical protein
MNVLKTIFVFISAFIVLSAIFLIPLALMGFQGSWYTLAVLGMASALITAIIRMPVDVPRGTDNDQDTEQKL